MNDSENKTPRLVHSELGGLGSYRFEIGGRSSVLTFSGPCHVVTYHLKGGKRFSLPVTALEDDDLKNSAVVFNIMDAPRKLLGGALPKPRQIIMVPAVPSGLVEFVCEANKRNPLSKTARPAGSDAGVWWGRPLAMSCAVLGIDMGEATEVTGLFFGATTRPNEYSFAWVDGENVRARDFKAVPAQV